MATLLALVNLVAASLVAWVVGADGGDGKGNDSEKFHFFNFLKLSGKVYKVIRDEQMKISHRMARPKPKVTACYIEFLGEWKISKHGNFSTAVTR